MPIDARDEEGEEEEGDEHSQGIISQRRPEQEGKDEVPHSATSANRFSPEDYDEAPPSKTESETAVENLMHRCLLRHHLPSLSRNLLLSMGLFLPNFPRPDCVASCIQRSATVTLKPLDFPHGKTNMA